MIGLPERIEILKLAASLLPDGPQATMRSRVMAALNLADILECNLSAGRSFSTIGIRVAACPLADWAALSVPASVDRLGDLRQQIEHGILVRRNGVRKGVEQTGDKALTGKFPVGVGRHDESSPVSGVEAYRLEDAGDGVMSSPDTAAIPDDFDAALVQRAGEKMEIVTGQGGVSGYSKKTEGVKGANGMQQVLANTALLTRLSVPVTEEERAAFNALPSQSRADILGRMLEAMRALHRTRPDGVYFVFANPVCGFDPQTFCLTEGQDGERHQLPAYETLWQP